LTVNGNLKNINRHTVIIFVHFLQMYQQMYKIVA